MSSESTGGTGELNVDNNGWKQAERQRGRAGVRGGGQGRASTRAVISDEIRATVIDHVLVHGMTMRQAEKKKKYNPI